MVKIRSFVLLLPISVFGSLVLERGSQLLWGRQIASTIIAGPEPSRGVNKAANNPPIFNSTDNSTDGIDPNASFMDEFPVDEGGTGPNMSTLDPNLSGRRQKRATVTNFGSEYVTFANGTNDFNITFAKCALKWGQVVGRWTFFNHSTHDYVTWLDIYRDVCAHAGIPGNGGQQLNTPAYLDALNDALLINNNALISESTDLMNLAIKNLTSTTSVSCPAVPNYDAQYELRRLLALPNNHWTFIFILAVVTGGINTGLWYSAFGENATAWQVANIGLSAAVLVLASGVVGWVMSHPRVENVDRQLAAGASSGARQTVHTVSNVAQGIRQATGNHGSQQSLLNMGAAVNHDPGTEAVGGGVLTGSTSAQRNLGVPGSESTICLTEIVVEDGVAGVQDLSAPQAGLTPFSTVAENIAAQPNDGSGSCYPSD